MTPTQDLEAIRQRWAKQEQRGMITASHQDIFALLDLLDAAVAEGAALREALGWFSYHASNQDMNHVDYRVDGSIMATNALTSTTLSSDYQERLRKAEAMARTGPRDLLDGVRTAFADQSAELINRIVLFARFFVRCSGGFRTPGYFETCGTLVGMDKDEFCGTHPGEACPYDLPDDCPIRASASGVT